jgi:hypothetical protein
MNINDLVTAYKNFVITPEHIEALRKRLDDMESLFEQEAKNRRLPEGWLNKKYTI